MKFKIGRLYKVVKGSIDPNCAGCVLRYKGIDEEGAHYGRPVKLGKWCKEAMSSGCMFEFQRVMKQPDKYKLVEYESMTKFCKKLRKELRS